MKELLQSGLKQLHLPVKGREVDCLLLHLDEIKKWNQRFGLVRAEDNELVIKHILDSLAGLSVIRGIKHRAHVADVGSGAGFPGLPLALFMPDSAFLLIERSERRAAFLRNVVVLLDLKNVDVTRTDLQDIKESFDIVVFRAFSRLPDRISALERITGKEGIIAAYKGRAARIQKEIEEVAAKFEKIRVIPLKVPFLREERHLVLLYRYASSIR